MNQSPEAIFVRHAQDNDIAVVAEHKELSAAESSRYRGTPASIDTEATLTFVGGVGTTVFGSISIGPSGNGRWDVVHVFVEPDAREIGIGDALLNECLAYLRQHGAVWLSASALPGDRAMKNLFERHGLVAQTIIVGKSLSDPSTGADASQ